MQEEPSQQDILSDQENEHLSPLLFFFAEDRLSALYRKQNVWKVQSVYRRSQISFARKYRRVFDSIVVAAWDEGTAT